MAPKHILFVSKAASDASTRYRALQYYPLLVLNSFKPTHVTVSGGLRALLTTLWQAYRADVVVVVRKTFPYLITRLLRLVSKKLIFDFDDAIFCNSNGTRSPTRMHRFKVMINSCDYVFAGNQFLAEKARQYNQAVTLVPTSLDVNKYIVNSHKPMAFIDLVWIGSKSTSKYLLDILPLLERAAQIVPNLRLKIIADFDLPEALIPVLPIAWSEEAEAQELASSHIGIAPMRDNDWTRGKCALKVLQYMAAELPVISSNVGVNGEAVISDKTGCLVETPEEWVNAICTLAMNKQLCTAMAKEGRTRVKEQYDLNVVFQQMLTVFKQC